MYSNKFVLGSALARFERSTFPEHKGTRTVVLRFLKIILPLKCVIPLYDGYVVPSKEGLKESLIGKEDCVREVSIYRIRQCGMLILTTNLLRSDSEVLNYFGDT